jgi:tyrosyl-DNA phosphodiesterase 2
MSLRVVTWNVWCGQERRLARQHALWSELERLDPDVICLQEVVSEHRDGPEIESLRERGWWVSHDRIYIYDVLMLARVPVVASERMSLISLMGRELVVAQLELEPRLTVATVHLESNAQLTDVRVRQLQAIDERLRGESNALLVGDMNFPDGERPEAEVLTGWRDVWPAVHGNAPGYTVDSELNRMRAASQPEHAQKRIDRAFLRGSGWRVEAIERLGTKPLRDEPDTWISDHFGLCVDLRPADLGGRATPVVS